MKIENDRFSVNVACLYRRQNIKFGDFTLSSEEPGA